MRLTYSKARELASEFEQTGRSVKKLANDCHVTQAIVRLALRMCGVDEDRPHKHFRCQWCGRVYNHSYCHVCKRGWCQPTELRKRPGYEHEPAAREYAVERRQKVTVFAAK